MVNKGFKPASPAASLNKSKGRKRSLKTSPSAGKELKFIIPEPGFPDLATIDKCFSASLTEKPSCQFLCLSVMNH
jgi:hypothetical protein